MDFPFDIFDHIFCFLISDPECLIACSEASPVFSRIAEKYQYYHVVIHTGEAQVECRLEPSCLTKLLSDKPRIANYVRVFQVEFPYQQVALYLDQITSILPMFPVLECIVLSTPGRNISWEKDLSRDFRRAVEDCLHLPTLKEVHVECFDFPLSTLGNHANIDCFSFSGTPKVSEFADTAHLQLISLSLEDHFFDERDLPTIFNAWAIQHIDKLQSLKCDYSNDERVLELLVGCSSALNTLDLSLSGFTTSDCEFTTGRIFYIEHCIESTIPVATTYEIKERHARPDRDIPIPRVKLSSLLHLQHLTIRTTIYFYRGDVYDYYESCNTFLPAAMEILKTASSLQQLSIEINLDLSSGYRNFYDSATIDDVDFSPLTYLAESPASIRHIDIYFNFESRKFTHAKIVSLLAKYGGLMELIERGVLVIHMDTAPTFLDKGSKRAVHRNPRSLLRMFASTYY